jgi:hypothetical protein
MGKRHFGWVIKLGSVTFFLFSDHVLKTVKSDYREMRTMIFGEYPAIEAIMAQLQALEDEINGLKS